MKVQPITDEQAADLTQLCQSDATIASAHRLTQDFLCMVRERQGERLDAWIEAVVVRRGTGPDALHDHEPMKVYNHNPDGVVLRLRSVILDKSLKLRCVVCRYRG